MIPHNGLHAAENPAVVPLHEFAEGMVVSLASLRKQVRFPLRGVVIFRLCLFG